MRYNGAFDYEIQDVNTRQFLRRFAVGSTTGAITVRNPGFGSTSVLDYEEYVQFELTMQVRACGMVQRSPPSPCLACSAPTRAGCRPACTHDLPCLFGVHCVPPPPNHARTHA